MHFGTPQGVQHEADQRHAEILVRELSMREANPVMTPGVKEKPSEMDEDKPKGEGWGMLCG